MNCSPDRIAADVHAIEAMGYSALWLPEGGGSNDILTNLGWALGASERLTVASGIANISAREPEVLARGAAFLGEANGGRLVLGIGVGHSYSTERRGIEWSRPLARMGRYLDVMDDATSPWRTAPRVLAALGDGMLRVAATRALGAHSYFVPVAHTAHARSVLGDEPVLAVELGVLPGVDDETARSWARAWAVHYLELPNYANNWRRMGFGDDDVAGARFGPAARGRVRVGIARADRRAGAGAPRRGCRPRLRPGDRRARRGCGDRPARPRGLAPSPRRRRAIGELTGRLPGEPDGPHSESWTRFNRSHGQRSPRRTSPQAAGTLEVGGTDAIYWETGGRPDGKPALVLHGGPGSGCTPWHRTLSIPVEYRVVLFDQRNCGRSTPHASEPDIDLSANTTQNLIADIEAPAEPPRGRALAGVGRLVGQHACRSRTPKHTRDRVTEMILWGITPVGGPKPTGSSGAASRRCSPSSGRGCATGVPDSSRGRRRRRRVRPVAARPRSGGARAAPRTTGARGSRRPPTGHPARDWPRGTRSRVRAGVRPPGDPLHPARRIPRRRRLAARTPACSPTSRAS